MINFGDVGAGKSTSLNWMFERFANKFKPEYKETYSENIVDFTFESV